MQISALILESAGGIGKTSGKPYNFVLCKMDGKVVKVFSDVSLKDFEGQEVDLQCDITASKDLHAGIRIVGVK